MLPAGDDAPGHYSAGRPVKSPFVAPENQLPIDPGQDSGDAPPCPTRPGRKRSRVAGVTDPNATPTPSAPPIDPTPSRREPRTPGKTEWSSFGADILGPDFSSATLDLGRDPDREGSVVATLVRYDGPGEHRRHRRESPPASSSGRPGMLWIHGFTDYFFQRHIAERFARTPLHPAGVPPATEAKHTPGRGTEGDSAPPAPPSFAFYALDLRKCGRSHRPGQTYHFVTDMRRYNEEIDAAVELILARHDTVLLVGHSTGGLTAALWAQELPRRRPDLAGKITGLILNSPWLDLQFPAPVRLAARALAATVGRCTPRLSLPARSSPGPYGRTTHRQFDGEWDFSLSLKPVTGHRRPLGWLRAVIAAQRALHHGPPIELPILVLSSGESRLGKPYSPAAAASDTVLNVAQIRDRGRALGPLVTLRTIPGALHDVFLSSPSVRERAFTATERWLARQLAPASDSPEPSPRTG